MSEKLVQRGIGRYFRTLGPRTQVALCQLPLTLMSLASALLTPFAWPSLLISPLYLVTSPCIGILFVACFLIPWERLPSSAYLVIPVLDLLAIGLLTQRSRVRSARAGDSGRYFRSSGSRLPGSWSAPALC